MSCSCGGSPPETVACLESKLAGLIAAAEALCAQQPQPAPPICGIPPYPPGATDEQKIAALRCAIDMVVSYIGCINGDPDDWSSCVAGVCSNFAVCWNAAFGIV